MIWFTGFALVFILFLRNERFFSQNRVYLIVGILASILLPFFSVHYYVDLPLTQGIQTDMPVMSSIQEASVSGIMDIKWVLLYVLYTSGALVVVVLFLKQSKTIIKAIKAAEIINSPPVKLIRTSEYSSSFSFFSYVFVNPSITDIETKEIMNHELVHIRQKHWIDLLLVELLCMCSGLTR